MKYILSVFLLSTFISGGIKGQESTEILITPELISALAEEARTNNSSLWSLRSRVVAAEENARSIPLWQDPHFMVGGMAAETSMRREDGDVMYGIEQDLPIFGKEKAARQVALAEVSVQSAELEERYQELRKDIAIALFNAALADEVLQLSRVDLEWLETLVRVTEDRYALGTASQVEVLQAQNELSRTQEQVRTDQNNREVAYVVLNRLLNRNVHAAWPVHRLPAVANPIPFSERLVSLALRYEPRIRVLEQEVERARAGVRAARTERRPDLSVALEGRQYSGTGEPTAGAILLKVTLPWLNRDRYKAAERREEATAQAAEHLLEDSLHGVREEVHHLIAAIDNARRQAVVYRDQIIPRSEQALASAEAGWRAGRDVFRTVLETRRMLIESRQMYAKAVAEQYIAMSTLVLCCGLGDLEALEMISRQDAKENNE